MPSTGDKILYMLMQYGMFYGGLIPVDKILFCRLTKCSLVSVYRPIVLRSKLMCQCAFTAGFASQYAVQSECPLLVCRV